MLPLAGLAFLAGAFFSDLSEREELPDADLVDLPDWELWDLTISGGDVLGDMTFAQAVNGDSRRVEALITQRIQIPILDAMAPLMPPDANEFRREAYLRRNHGLRETHGAITPAVIADTLEAEIAEYLPILERALWPMAGHGDAASQRIQAVFVDHSDGLLRALREARAIALKAAQISNDPADAVAWRKTGDVLRQAWAPFLERLEHLQAAVPELPWTLPPEDLEEGLRERLEREDMAILPTPPPPAEYTGLFSAWGAHA